MAGSTAQPAPAANKTGLPWACLESLAGGSKSMRSGWHTLASDDLDGHIGHGKLLLNGLSTRILAGGRLHRKESS
jgi:hypothetical protein